MANDEAQSVVTDFCKCIQQVAYALEKANIPTHIFEKMVCHNHERLRRRQYVECYVYQDPVITEDPEFKTWVTSYYCTSVDKVWSTLRHGEILMSGDVKNDGSYFDADEKGIRTYVSKTCAVAFPHDTETTAAYDDGQTTLEVMLQLRQKPGTYTKSSVNIGECSYETRHTMRRGSIYIEALCVLVKKCGGTSLPYAPLPIPARPFVNTFTCSAQEATFEFLQTLNIPASLFDSTYNRCYCQTCSPYNFKAMQVAGETYVIPFGWVRFGLAVNPLFEMVNAVWDSWNNAFHGCDPHNVESIIKHRALLIPHDTLNTGVVLTVCSSRNKNQKNYFLSPSIWYSAHERYAKVVKYQTRDGKTMHAQAVVCFKVRPGTFGKQRETEAGENRMVDDYSLIKEDEIEWFSSCRGCTHAYGVLIRVLDDKALQADVKP